MSQIMPKDLILDTHTYKMELHLPGLSWISGQGAKVKILSNLDSYDIGASFSCPVGDSWFLTYHLKATGRIITHGEMFDNCITPVYDRTMWIDCIDLGVIEPLFTPDIPLPEPLVKAGKDFLTWLKDYWYIGMVFIVAVLTIPLFYKRGKK